MQFNKESLTVILKNLSLLTAAGVLMTYTINVQAQCEVKYTINSNWGSGATLSVDITNLGAPKTSWELAWNFSNAEKISQLWNGNFTQASQAVRVRNAGWNGNLSTNQTTNFGFNISMPNGTSLVRPAEFYLNGTKCVGRTPSSASSSKVSSSAVSSSRSSSSSSSSRISSSVSSSSLRPSSSSAMSSSVRSLPSSSAVSSSVKSSSSSSLSSSSSSSTPPLANCNGNITYGPRLLRVLTRAEYSNSIRDLTGVNLATDLPAGSVDLLLANTHVNGFDNNTQDTINKFVLGNFAKLARNIVDKAAANNFSTLINCTGLTAEQCATQFTNESLTRIFRRPATATEAQEYSALFTGATTSEHIKTALALALRTALTSPQFLYRQETGIAVSELRAGNTSAALPNQPIDNDAYVLTPHELASFLAFTFTGSTPDTELLDAAKNGGLANDALIEAQVSRLLSKPSAANHFTRFAHQWLQTEGIADRTAHSVLYNQELTPAITSGMDKEVQGLFTQIVLNGAGNFSELFSSNYSYLTESLINFYGVGSVNITTDAVRKVTMPAHIRRGGLLTTGAFIASKSTSRDPDQRHLALAVRNRLLCQDAYKPLPYISQQLRSDPFWNVGFAFEHFSTIGLRRTLTFDNAPVNPAGVLTGVTFYDDGNSIAYANAEELAQKLSTLDTTRYCFAEHNFRAAFGTGTKTFDPSKPDSSLSAPEQADYACEKDRLDYAMTSNSMSARALLKRLGSLPAARYRKDRSQ